MSIYCPCDIRGSAVTELTPRLYRGWGRALGAQVPPKAKFVVGGDHRLSTPEFSLALIGGLCQSGVDVVDLGIVPTPMVFYAKSRLQAAGCAMVTGAHHATPANGLKWMVGEFPPTVDDVAALRRAVESDSDLAAAENAKTPGRQNGREPMTPRTIDISFDYVASLQEMFVNSLTAQRHVVLDPMSGCWASIIRRYLNAIFPQCLFSTINNAPIPDFDGHEPNCLSSIEVNPLSDAVYRERAHLGIAFDGDGDRLALVDNDGVFLGVDETAWLLLRSLGPALSGQLFVHDVRLSDRIVEAARQLGAEPVVERGGTAWIRAQMTRTGALFGVESTGHYFHRELGGGDDSLYTACRLIAWLARTDRSLADLRRDGPTVYITPDLRVPLAEDAGPRAMEQIRAAWRQCPQQTIDGVRIDTPSGRICASVSVTEPSLSLRFEGADWVALDNLVEQFCQKLPELGDPLWRQYRTAMGTEEA